jgi:hypothetical protein
LPPIAGSKRLRATASHLARCVWPFITPSHLRLDGESVIERAGRYEVVSKADADV